MTRINTNEKKKMKKTLAIIALVAAFCTQASAQSSLGSVLGSLGEKLSGVIYTAPISLDGTYEYTGSAVSVTSSEGGILSSLAGTAVTTGIETKVDEYLAMVGIKPGAMSFTFNQADDSFTLNIAGMAIPGNYRVGDGEKTITLNFGKSMQFLSMTGTLETTSTSARMLFTVDKAMALIKKVAGKLGESSSKVAGIAKLAEGYDNYRIGFRMAK